MGGIISTVICALATVFSFTSIDYLDCRNGLDNDCGDNVRSVRLQLSTSSSSDNGNLAAAFFCLDTRDFNPDNFDIEDNFETVDIRLLSTSGVCELIDTEMGPVVSCGGAENESFDFTVCCKQYTSAMGSFVRFQRAVSEPPVPPQLSVESSSDLDAITFSPSIIPPGCTLNGDDYECALAESISFVSLHAF